MKRETMNNENQSVTVQELKTI